MFSACFIRQARVALGHCLVRLSVLRNLPRASKTRRTHPNHEPIDKYSYRSLVPNHHIFRTRLDKLIKMLWFANNIVDAGTSVTFTPNRSGTAELLVFYRQSIFSLVFFCVCFCFLFVHVLQFPSTQHRSQNLSQVKAKGEVLKTR